MKEVEIDTKTLNYYTVSKNYMSLPDEVENDTKMFCTGSVTACREVFISRIIKNLLSSKKIYKQKDFSKFRVIQYSTGLTEKEIEECLNLLHSIEAYHGLKATEVSKALIWMYNFPKNKSETSVKKDLMKNTYLFEADPFWLQSSPLISLYLLILRFSISNFKYLKKHNLLNIDALFKWAPTASKIGHLKDGSYVKTSIKHWYPVLSNASVLFPKKKTLPSYYSQFYTYNNIFNIMSSSAWINLLSVFGISAFVKKDTSNSFIKFKAYKKYHTLNNN